MFLIFSGFYVTLTFNCFKFVEAVETWSL